MTISVKATLFFETPDAEGWSESWYMAPASISAGRASMDIIITARLAMLPTDMTLIYARVSDVAVKGDSLISALALPLPGTYNFTGFSLLEANTAVLAELFATSLIKNRIFLRGLSSDVVTGRQYVAPTAFDSAFSTWGTTLLSNATVVRHRTAIGPPPTYSYTALNSVFTVGATARKPGRPFGLPVGRRRR